MNEKEKKYFDLSYAKLGEWLTPSYEELLERYTKYPQEFTLEEVNEYVYYLFCYPVLDTLEQGILLVYEKENIIADLAFVHSTMHDTLTDTKIYDYMSEDSDWSYLQHYIICNYFYPSLPYPYTKKDILVKNTEVIYFTNIYVTKRYRQQHIFSRMLDISKEQVLRYMTGDIHTISIISLDPDIACYGEDTPNEPYIYSMKDEKDRMRNKAILEKKGYMALKLEETQVQENSDGTKLWFAINKENVHIEQVEKI